MRCNSSCIRGRLSADDARDELWVYVNEKLGEEDGVLIVDETVFFKQGKMFGGVKRQYSGTAGRIQNCQMGVGKRHWLFKSKLVHFRHLPHTMIKRVENGMGRF